MVNMLFMEGVLVYSAFYERRDVRFLPDDIQGMATRLGERIRAARICRKLRQQDLAQRTGFSRSSIQNIEKGDTGCSLAVILQVLWDLDLARIFHES